MFLALDASPPNNAIRAADNDCWDVGESRAAPHAILRPRPLQDTATPNRGSTARAALMRIPVPGHRCGWGVAALDRAWFLVITTIRPRVAVGRIPKRIATTSRPARTDEQSPGAGVAHGLAASTGLNEGRSRSFSYRSCSPPEPVTLAIAPPAKISADIDARGLIPNRSASDALPTGPRHPGDRVARPGTVAA
jgi:hypothetical protein